VSEIPPQIKHSVVCSGVGIVTFYPKKKETERNMANPIENNQVRFFSITRSTRARQKKR